MRKTLEDMIFTYSESVKQKFGRKVFRVGLSTGIKCPHRVKNGGCFFCNPETFTGSYQSEGLTVRQQLENAVPRIMQTTGATELLAYFQDETSTAGDVKYLDKIFSEALNFENIIGLIVSTRPEYVTREIITLLKSYQVPVSIEIGLQSVHEKSLKLLNRGHGLAEVENAVKLCAENQLDLGVHIITGIPRENISEMRQTIDYISSRKAIKEVKFHNLVVYKNTALEKLHQKEKFDILTIDDQIRVLTQLIPYLRGDIVVSRLFTSNIRRTQIALGDYNGTKPEWLNKLRLALIEHNLYQGCETEIPYKPELDLN